MAIIYIIDTSELINLKNRYPKETFPNLWGNIEGLISKGRILAPKQVYDEIKYGDDELLEWCKEHRCMFQDMTDMMEKAQEIISKHPTIINHNAPEDTADPYIITLAYLHKYGKIGEIPIIVTAEKVTSEKRFHT